MEAKIGAHPRSRGENCESSQVLLCELGSSPLTRGKLPSRPQPPAKTGLIPAHAGKTPLTASSWTKPPAHPRSRGENSRLHRRPHDEGGSSPLTRGKHLDLTAPDPSRGLIPAHAGKTAPFPLTATSLRAHPRSRGENPSTSLATACVMGSSPLTRGKRDRRRYRNRSPGLIPAHAGKTPGRWARASSARAHPRSRGENNPSGVKVLPKAGSSPLTRGKLTLDDPGHVMRGLIPAHAGKTITG